MISITCKQKEALFKAKYESQTTSSPFNSIMSFPMFHDGEVFGLIVIGDEEESAFSFGSLKIMETLVQNTTLAITNSSDRLFNEASFEKLLR